MGKDELEKRVHSWLENGFFALASVILVYCADQIGTINRSISDLTIKLTTYISRIDSQEQYLKDHEVRLRSLERK